MTKVNFLLTISIHYQKKRLLDLIKWSPQGKCFDLLSNSLNLFFKEMYGDQFGAFVSEYFQILDYIRYKKHFVFKRALFLQLTPDNSNLQGKSKKVRNIWSSEQRTGNEERKQFLLYIEHFNHLRGKVASTETNLSSWIHHHGNRDCRHRQEQVRHFPGKTHWDHTMEHKQWAQLKWKYHIVNSPRSIHDSEA